MNINIQEDITHLLQSLDRAIEQLDAARQLLRTGQRGALHRIVEGASMAAYCQKLAVKIAKRLTPTDV